MGIKLVIQIPVFNEEKDIGAVLDGIPPRISGVDSVETLIINDGSTDKTLREVQSRNIKQIVNFPMRCGLGIAFREGLKYACNIGADIIVNIDGDNQYQAYEIQNIIKPILNDKADMVIGDRQLYTIPRYPLYKLLSQSIGNFLVSKLFHTLVKDVTSGLRAFTSDCAHILIKELKNDYTYTLESVCILIKRKKRVVYAPVAIHYPSRTSRLITNKIFYVQNFLTTLLRHFTAH